MNQPNHKKDGYLDDLVFNDRIILKPRVMKFQISPISYYLLRNKYIVMQINKFQGQIRHYIK